TCNASSSTDRRSETPAGDIACCRRQHAGARTIGLEKLDGLRNQPAELMPRPIEAMQRREGRLAGGCIFPRGLADHSRIARGIQKVVGDLEGKSDRRAELGQPFPVVTRSSTENCSRLAGKAE